MPCDLARLLAVARQHGLPVVEDAACAIGSEIEWQGDWQRIGRPHGDIACFSFHPRKVITTGDGGMLTTANRDYDAKFRLWRQHAMSVPDTVRHGAREVIFESYPELGYNYRMTDLQAAIGREQLKRLPGLVATRRHLAGLYAEALGNIKGLQLPFEPAWARSNWQSYCVTLPETISQRQVMQSLLDQGVSARRGVMNSHQEPAYAEPGTCRVPASLARSEAARDRGVMLPLFAQMSEGDVAAVAAALERAIAN
jgi:dTDP-4-amino-4,6-dideoxygalactose transaminase